MKLKENSMKALFSIILFISVQAAYAAEITEKAGPTATTATKLETPKSPQRTAIILGSSVLGAVLGYSVGRANTAHDNKYSDIAATTLGTLTGLAIGSYVGLKFYPPIVAVQDEQGERTTSLSMVMDF
jgi:hypothetical protein